MSDQDKALDIIIEDIWKNYDKDNNGTLDKEETRNFTKSTLMQMNDYSESQGFTNADFDECFKDFDKDGNGVISKREMKIFIKKVAGL